MGNVVHLRSLAGDLFVHIGEICAPGPGEVRAATSSGSIEADVDRLPRDVVRFLSTSERTRAAMSRPDAAPLAECRMRSMLSRTYAIRREAGRNVLTAGRLGLAEALAREVESALYLGTVATLKADGPSGA